MARLGPRFLRPAFWVANTPFPQPSLSMRKFGLYDQVKEQLERREQSQVVRINGYNETGFTANGEFYEGGLVCLRTLVLGWSPKTFEEITPDSLALFQLLRPAPEILLLGSGRTLERVDPKIQEFLRTNGIKVEPMSSRHAASTFNFLNEEGRRVAAALLPYGALKS